MNTPHVNLSIKWAGGGYLSTVDDLIKFGNAMLYSYQYTDKHKGMYKCVAIYRDQSEVGSIDCEI